MPISGEADGFGVEILDYAIVKDDDGNDCIEIFFNFTNNSNDKAKALGHTAMHVYQNGIPLTLTIPDLWGCSDEYTNNLSDIKPGATIKCSWYYRLSDKNPVDVELGILGDRTLAYKTFIIE